MDNFESLVRRAEKKSINSPKVYKLELLLFSLLGYSVIFLSLTALVGLVIGLIWLGLTQGAYAAVLLFKSKIIFVLIPVIWILFKAVWVKIPAPQGYELTRKDFPEFFEMLDALVLKLDTPKIHQVLLTSEFNAAIVQTPRFGMFGWTKNTLIVGLELLLTMSPEEAKSVVAHELGHLSGNHGRFAGWIYRVRLSWERIIEAIQRQESFGASIMVRFFNWYHPKFNAYSFALARANEYEADAISAHLTSSRDAGAALVKVNTYSTLLEQEFWNPLFKRADKEKDPKHRPWESLNRLISSPDYRDTLGGTQKLQQALDNSLKVNTNYADTHPSLKDRLSALKASALLPDAVSESAAKLWLGAKFESTLRSFDQEWYDHIKPSWEQRYETAQQEQKRLIELSTKDQGNLEVSELWEKATLVHEYMSVESATPIYETILRSDCNHAGAAFNLGCIALDNDDIKGLDLMRIASKNREYVMAACEVSYSWSYQKELTDEMNFWETLANDFIQKSNEAQQERAQLTKKDKLVTAELSKELRDHIVDTLSQSKKVKKVWVARKVTKHDNDEQVLAIAFTPKGFSTSYESLAQELAEKLQLESTFYVIPKADDYKPLAKYVIKHGEQLL